MAVFTISFKSYSQDSIRTLVHLPKITHVGIYIAPEFQYGQLKGEFTSFGGGSAMLLFNKKFGFGVTMQHSIFLSYSPKGISPLDLMASYGGLKLEYTCNPNAPIHLSFPLVIGGGSARLDSATYFRSILPDTNTQGDRMHREFDQSVSRNNYFVVQPGVQVEGNLFRFLKLYAGANYRFAFETYSSNSKLLPASTLQGLSLNVGLKVGFFDYTLKKKNK